MPPTDRNHAHTNYRACFRRGFVRDFARCLRSSAVIHRCAPTNAPPANPIVVITVDVSL